MAWTSSCSRTTRLCNAMPVCNVTCKSLDVGRISTMFTCSPVCSEMRWWLGCTFWLAERILNKLHKVWRLFYQIHTVIGLSHLCNCLQNIKHCHLRERCSFAAPKYVYIFIIIKHLFFGFTVVHLKKLLIIFEINRAYSITYLVAWREAAKQILTHYGG